MPETPRLLLQALLILVLQKKQGAGGCFWRQAKEFAAKLDDTLLSLPRSCEATGLAGKSNDRYSHRSQWLYFAYKSCQIVGVSNIRPRSAKGSAYGKILTRCGCLTTRRGI